MNIYKKALQNKERFEYRGLISVEDLFDLSLEQLDIIFGDLKSKEKANNTESLLNTNSEDESLNLKIAIVEDVFKTKKAKIEAIQNEAKIKEKNQKILDIIHRKQNAELEEKDISELESMLK